MGGRCSEYQQIALVSKGALCTRLKYPVWGVPHSDEQVQLPQYVHYIISEGVPCINSVGSPQACNRQVLECSNISNSK